MLSVTELRVGYGQSEVVHSISFIVPRDSIVAIVGANGAGKTTTLKAISGLNRSIGGAITFEGEQIDGLSAERIVRRGIAHVPEGRRIFPQLTVRENLLIGGYTVGNRGLIQRRIDDVLEVFPILRERYEQLGSTLSGGEQQMLALARSLIAAPRLLLLDEPTMGLAPMMAERVANYVLELRTSGVTVLLIEQNASIALDISDYAYVLETGRIVLEGRSDVLRNDDRIRQTYLGI
ncbi:MAG: ABC transporter ATP-binding protein [bacterium]|nr:ABC transporter ATP-binding protein [bacterium]